MTCQKLLASFSHSGPSCSDTQTIFGIFADLNLFTIADDPHFWCSLLLTAFPDTGDENRDNQGVSQCGSSKAVHYWKAPE
jgi:hypothetical protein